MTLEEAKEKYPEIPVGRAKNMTGLVFGELTPLWKTKTTNSRGEAYWLCECSCGNYKELNAVWRPCAAEVLW